ncbi:MAG: hypothetical protein II942_00185 [Alphaproteobacteria bacterium]|nr:hypothetical protein [Alphaproteobacteria bacterium]
MLGIAIALASYAALNGGCGCYRRSSDSSFSPGSLIPDLSDAFDGTSMAAAVAILLACSGAFYGVRARCRADRAEKDFAGTRQELVEKTGISLNSCPNTPLTLSEKTGISLISCKKEPLTLSEKTGIRLESRCLD